MIRRFLGGDILGAVSGIELRPGPPVELFARYTPDGWNSGNDKIDGPNLTGAIYEWAAGPTGPNREAIPLHQATGVNYGPTGHQPGTGPLN